MSHKNCLNRLKNTVSFFVLVLSFFLLFVFSLSNKVYAQTADKISLQGKIVRNDTGYEGLNVVNGTPSCVNSGPDTCNFQVKYYSASTSGTLYFTETFSGIEIGDYGGVFNLTLGSGSTTTTSECDDGTCNTVYEVINDFNSIYIEISFDPAGGTSYGEVFTRTALNASAYAIKSTYSTYSEGSVDDAFQFYDASSVSSSIEGSVYYDTDTDELMLRTASGWVALNTSSSGSSAWYSEDISSFTYLINPPSGTYMTSSGVGTLSNFSLDIDDDRLSINANAQRGGLTVYSSYNSTGAWPLVSFKADGSSYDSTLLELTQDGTGDILTAYYGSDLEFQVDNQGDLHLANNGITYFEHFSSTPTSGDLHPNTSGSPATSDEGCLYSVSGSLYWDPTCEATSAIQLGSGSTSLWTDAGTYTYLASTTDDLVLGSSTTSSPPFFFDVS
ncbi:MAG: hypothetical protein PHP08_02755, partial [Candidatus Dojkabacteria bacterium]|nr:hypothetical protein [Candidatus Dojkabacteria bacterium]